MHEAGDEVWYYERGVGWTPSGVAAVHRNDVTPYYTISHKGRERETEAQHHAATATRTRTRPATLASLPRRPPPPPPVTEE